jgi:hypothetical protein
MEEITPNISPFLAFLELQDNKYIANLPLWDQYVIWTYTLGSQAVNRRLAGIPFSKDLSQKWAYDLFFNWRRYNAPIGYLFSSYRRLFVAPSAYMSLGDELRTSIADELLDKYSINLQHIIMGAPVTQGDITVYKASTPYDPRLEGNSFPFTLLQKPFNSTTYSPQFDFNAFLASNQATCCLWNILIPKGSHVMAITHPYQAYLTEREIILPIGCKLVVTGARQTDLSYHPIREAPERLQSNPPVIGEVFTHNPWEEREVRRRPVRLLLANYVNP